MRLQEKVERMSWANHVAQALKEEVDHLHNAGSLVIPSEPGGWWHQYVCPTHHTELLFDPAQTDASEFYCPHGCRIEGADYHGAWLVFKHQSLARSVLQSAAVHAALHDEAYANLSKRLLVAYAEQFPRYTMHPDAQGWMLRGRAFHQALTEAIWSTTLLRAYLLLLDQGVEFDNKERLAMEAFLDLLASSMMEYRHILIHDKDNVENNYTAWLNAALSCIYAVQGNPHLMHTLIEGEGGFKHHLSAAIKPDQMEFEGSIYYHLFVLRAYMISAEMASRFGIDLHSCEGSEGQSMKGMFEVLTMIADEQGLLPALHDGPMERLPYAREIAEVTEQGLTRYQLAGIAPILRQAYRQMGSPTGERCQLEALLYGEGPALSDIQHGTPRRSKHWPDSGFVVGRHANNPLSFLADYGEHGGAHGHLDKLHLTLMHHAWTLTPDMGVVPYGSTLRHSWFTETASHNTVSLDGISQNPHRGRCVHFEESEAGTYAWLQSTDAYGDCTLDRHILLTEGWLLDWYHVELDKGIERNIQWWMHPAMTPVSDQLQMLQNQMRVTFQTQEGELMLPVIGSFQRERSEPIQEADRNGLSSSIPSLVRIRYSGNEMTGKEGSHRASSPDGLLSIFHSALVFPGDELLALQTHGNSIDPSRELTALLHQRYGSSADFIHVFRAGESAELQWHSNNEIEISIAGSTNRIRLMDGKGLMLQ